MRSTTCSACTWDCRCAICGSWPCSIFITKCSTTLGGTAGLLLAATIHAEAVIDHIDGALHDETGTRSEVTYHGYQ
ncbi:unnamed protein product [Macrosiphum euphorbiae]|uniref:Uncharacterized protein n=1 Tax=Macrosiphum euphorbiae TaxID=13131 RepID=A0AAV0VMW7_9HEMI|nr:unnamed protein product [Macrosiphum euphorbiae]